ncbi:hypothetical protein Acsp06_61950 [Actinomycetospora sp. NBRC 106375]|uniref:hypothetical protein n=1 Tax=Actinomycetospora sp. NBRC 106375 TaxID=3032207 RepID=UPI0024A5C9CC|nr:hypothetical protein [Actinomycetospora sp. NBRC 106375]GLZ50010.1 hypothetical protein Acsp06_61950 [Actinomycetospora sp. NBRC 106375]
MSKNRTRASVLLGLVAVPAIMVGMALPASAAEVTPIAEYVDSTVADTEAEVGAVLDDLGLEAAD